MDTNSQILCPCPPHVHIYSYGSVNSTPSWFGLELLLLLLLFTYDFFVTQKKNPADSLVTPGSAPGLERSSFVCLLTISHVPLIRVGEMGGGLAGLC